MSREGKILITILVLMFGGGLYAYFDLKDRQRSIELRASMCSCPISTAGQVALGVIQQHDRANLASHSYFERMLEGLVRHAGLPLDNARQSLTKDLPGGLPAGWRWLPQWERSKPAPKPKP